MRKEFERVTPESVGIRSKAIMDYIDALERSNTEMHGLMIMRHGKICAEGWWQPFAPGLRHGLQSHTKTYAATAVGIAYTEGILRLDERLIDIFPEESPAQPSENLKKLTVCDVLCMGCGMDTMPCPTEHWIRDFLHTPVVHEPGTTYMYNSVGSSILGAIVRKKTGEGLHEYLTKRLFRKIGIDPENIRWYYMPDGMETGGGGMLATTEDNLRLMKLYADGGVWEGERILAEDYVRLATTNQNDSATESINNPEASDNFLGYGFQIWMCKPKGVYRADGAMGQFTIVCPDQDMLIAINETAIGAHWAQSTLDITWEFLKQIQDENGNVTENKDPVLVKKTISKETSDIIKDYMQGVVEEGTGASAAVEGYAVGGKTGTAEKLPRGNGKYLVSFIGYAPQENPQVMVYVVIDEPNSAVQANSGYATQLASQIMTDIFPYLGVEKKDGASDTIETSAEETTQE